MLLINVFKFSRQSQCQASKNLAFQLLAWNHFTFLPSKVAIISFGILSVFSASLVGREEGVRSNKIEQPNWKILFNDFFFLLP